LAEAGNPFFVVKVLIFALEELYSKSVVKELFARIILLLMASLSK